MRAFVIAMACEAEAVKPHLRPEDRLYVCGIGKVNAAAATQRAIDAGATEIWNCGLCGGFGEGLAIGEVYSVAAAVEYDFDLAELDGTRIGQLSERDSPYFRLGPAEGRILATGDRFNNSDADLSLLEELGCTLRDMEGAAIAHVCERNGVRCVLYKCVSDIHGAGPMTGQYEANKARCLESLSQAMEREMARDV